MADAKPAEGGWRLEKTVPLAVLVVVLVQLGGWLWAGGSQSNRLDTVETTQKQARKDAAPQAERLVRLEERVVSIQEGMRRIEELILRSRETALPQRR